MAKIFLMNFSEKFCKGRVALEVNDRKVLHKKYLEGLDAKIKETTTKNKKFTKNELKSIRDKLPNTFICYDVMNFWTNIAYLNEKDENLPENNINKITIIQKTLNSCRDINEINSILKFIQNVGVDRIKEINNNIQQNQKIETIEYYLAQKNGNPKWFINRLNELSKYREQILKYSLLDPFWCYIVDFGKADSIWNKIYERSLLDRLKTKCFHLDLYQIDDIISIVDQAYSDYNFSHEPPSIEIKSLNNKQKKWAEFILIRWIRQWINPYDNMLESDLVLNYIFIPLEIVLNKFLFGKFHLHGPEHPTQCSYERKKLYHRPPFAEWPKNLKEAVNLFEKPEDEHFDANDSVLETVAIIQNNGDEPIYIPNDKHKLLSFDTANEQGVTLFRVYSRKVDTAITYSPETGIKLYLLICEAKRLNKHQGGDYNKLCRMLNDAANSFILYWAKKCKKVTKELKKLFCEFRWIGLFSSDGKFNLMIYQICEETKIHFITYLNSFPVSIPISNMNHDMASALEIFLQIEDIFQMNLKVIEKIQKIVDQINIEESENFETPLEYLKKVIGETPSTPHK
ncbi:hypothetical protein C2G38_2147255 [Gigaspora rosea]|uniref:Uncharacterized protein n=1 Tax=Gigaspora rosea TaxID=44941 RepID=A0A397UL23_9GLOM|nr:hypothetical protein C2G38_2147255 [Gigaspora rosea]